MRVALLSLHTSPLAPLGGKDTGGMNVFVRETARELGRRGIPTDVFTRSTGTHALRIDPRLGENVRVIHVPAGPEAPLPKTELHQYVPDFADWVAGFAADQPPYTVIHAHYWLSGLAAERLRARCGTPFVITFHTLAALKNQIAERPEDRESELRLRGECHLCDCADRITANTAVEKTQLVRLYGAGSSRIRIVPPGVDPAQFHPIAQSYAKALVGIPADHRVLLFVGRIERLKGIDILLKAAALLRDRRSDLSWDKLRIIVIGGDPSEEGRRKNEEMARLHALRDALSLGDLVTFVGALDQDALAFYYAAAEMVIMPSHYESFGMVALEAMACGTPVVVSDVGGLSVLVQHNKTGLRVRANDPAALAQAIERLLDDEALRRRLGQRAVCYAEAYAWSNVVDRLLNVYAEIARPIPAGTPSSQHR
ncbi:MAG: glycosyltransferase [Anaerolineae bacterium]|nr:glycosyltransferase [Anaerolineae bacterium]